MEWVKHNELERTKYLYDLLKHVRFPILTRKFLDEAVKTDLLVQSSMECKNLYSEAVQCYDNPMHRLNLKSSSNRPRSVRKDFDLGIIIILSATSISYYDPYSNKFYFKTLNHDYFIPFTIAVSLNQRIYLLRSSLNDTNITYDNMIFDPITLDTSKFAPLSSSRILFGACSLNDKIYVCGGINLNKNSVNTVERFDPAENKWEALPPMSKVRIRPGVVALNGYIYVIGGYHDLAHEGKLDSVSHLY